MSKPGPLSRREWEAEKVGPAPSYVRDLDDAIGRLAAVVRAVGDWTCMECGCATDEDATTQPLADMVRAGGKGCDVCEDVAAAMAALSADWYSEEPKP